MSKIASSVVEISFNPAENGKTVMTITNNGDQPFKMEFGVVEP